MLLVALAKSKDVALDHGNSLPMRPRVLAAWGTIAARDSWLQGVFGRPGFADRPWCVAAEGLAATVLLGDQGILAAQGYHMARDSWLQGCS
ncbi:hypothetical protein B296_00015652 [Ensete ventricosum]|uniref:Uncharacterized protein n=1 Tax=Ensete ventricosum TaxID=4639 RepID=A0A426YKR8_ENSVE|nr:hypothetical protein B296_00015652 [Ensete ventricosum]